MTKFYIFQPKILKAEYIPMLFDPHELKKQEGSVFENYDLKYEGILDDYMIMDKVEDTLENIFIKFQRIDKHHTTPPDYTGKSLSMGDIIVLEEDNIKNAYVIVSDRFIEIDRFFDN